MASWRVDGGPPVAGRHYPRSFQEFERWFVDEVACRKYLADVRWRDGLVCPRCGSASLRDSGGERWWCPDCRRHTSLTSHTALDHTRVELRVWLAAAWYFTNEKTGVSARSLERAVGVHYRTAWHLLHRFRAALDQDGRPQLVGDVEVDESYFGGKSPGHRGRSLAGKVPVVIACECDIHGRIGRLRMATVPDTSAASLRDFITTHIEPGSVIITDGWGSYPPALVGQPYTHKATNISATGMPAHHTLPRVHRVAALVKRWLLGTHQGAVSADHLDTYLDEFVFRFNRRNARQRGLLFYRLLCDLIDTPRLSWAELTDPGTA